MNARLIGAGMVLAYGMTSGFGAEPQQGSDDATRQIVAEEFLKARPVPKKPLAAKRPRINVVLRGPSQDSSSTDVFSRQA